MAKYNPTRNEWIAIYVIGGIAAYAAIYYAYKYYSKNDPPANPQPPVNNSPQVNVNATPPSSYQASGSENYGMCNCTMSTAPISIEQQGYYVQSQAVCQPKG